jgi:hypothetical protein
MKRVTVLFSLLLLPPSLAGVLSAQEKQNLTAADIIGRNLAAVGDKDAIAKIRSRVAMGTAQKDSEAAVPLTIMSETPNRISAFYQFKEYNWQLTYDGNRSIFRPQFARASAVLMHKYEEMLASGTMFNGISLYNALSHLDEEGVKLEAKGTRKVKGRPAHVVEMKRGKGPSVRLYFDAETFMWVRSDYGSVRVTKDMGGFTNDAASRDEETTYDFYVETSDFKEVDGVKLPFKIEITATAPILRQRNAGTIVGTISEYRHNIVVDPRMFQ